MLFVGLNPSTADAHHDDATVRRCVGFGKRWGFDGLILVNLFAYRSTNPAALLCSLDPVGPANDRWIRRVSSEAKLTVAAWGARGAYLDRDQTVLELLHKPHCLGTTQRGHPRHPLYLPQKAEPLVLAV